VEIQIDRPRPPYWTRAFFFGSAMPEFTPYCTVAEIEEVVRRFEICEYKPVEFTHAKHVTVAAWYLSHGEKEAAKERMRLGLLRFIRHHGKNAFHETITQFWIEMIDHRLRRADSRGDLISTINEIASRLVDKNLIYEYYSRALLDSPEAKASWVEPNLKPIL
jgi:hypothetical protein